MTKEEQQLLYIASAIILAGMIAKPNPKMDISTLDAVIIAKDMLDGIKKKYGTDE